MRLVGVLEPSPRVVASACVSRAEGHMRGQRRQGRVAAASVVAASVSAHIARRPDAVAFVATEEVGVHLGDPLAGRPIVKSDGIRTL